MKNSTMEQMGTNSCCEVSADQQNVAAHPHSSFNGASVEDGVQIDRWAMGSPFIPITGSIRFCCVAVLFVRALTNSPRTHMHTHTYTHAHIHTYTRNTHTHSDIHTHTDIHTYGFRLGPRTLEFFCILEFVPLQLGRVSRVTRCKGR